ncbi:Protein of uncharacterised function (DUF2807) [Legionella wadsworthii]|uniref:Protein of uncharacterized function (DUF2807) n=1 Tax=Legionella wadsworthii TaxID=28088 RepID=A0A378LQ59_9GAMM|nr:DUF2807 domain-containing protein [Legionella wadsworthii]STY27978.1 Protein of uncharacterised function (DUF2807) [Legionella wadsworthii]
MQKRYYLLIVFAFFLTSCAHRAPKNELPPPEVIKTKQVRRVPSFNQVHVEGQINVSLHTGYKEPQVILSGDARDLTTVKAEVTQNTLYLSLIGKGSPLHAPIYAEVRGQFLNRLMAKKTPIVTGDRINTRLLDIYLEDTDNVRLGGSIGLRVLDVKGKGLVRINGVYSPNLQLHLQGSPKVQLSGMVNLANLNMQGDAWLSLYWVKTDNLTVRAKNKTRIQLAGAVNRLDVELWGNARFKGRYLRAQRSFVKTHDHSVAEISVAKHQSNLATDASDIYYFNLPTTRADFMAYNGSVLDMREWNQFDLKDFNRYNHQFP